MTATADLTAAIADANATLRAAAELAAILDQPAMLAVLNAHRRAVNRVLDLATGGNPDAVIAWPAGRLPSPRRTPPPVPVTRQPAAPVPTLGAPTTVGWAGQLPTVDPAAFLR